jgi:hypothetical protein
MHEASRLYCSYVARAQLDTWINTILHHFVLLNTSIKGYYPTSINRQGEKDNQRSCETHFRVARLTCGCASAFGDARETKDKPTDQGISLLSA